MGVPGAIHYKNSWFLALLHLLGGCFAPAAEGSRQGCSRSSPCLGPHYIIRSSDGCWRGDCLLGPGYIVDLQLPQGKAGALGTGLGLVKACWIYFFEELKFFMCEGTGSLRIGVVDSYECPWCWEPESSARTVQAPNH